MKKNVTIKQRAEFLEYMKTKYKTKREIFEFLAKSSGSGVSSANKWFCKPESNNYRDCPYAVWRCWMIDTGYEE